MLPAIAFLILGVSPACAHRLPTCLKPAAKATQSLADLKECQEQSWEDFRTKKDAQGALPTTEDMDKLDEKQRAEARALMARSNEVLDGHSRHGVLVDEPDLGSKKGAVSALKDGEAMPAGAHPGELGGVTDSDLSRADAKSAKSIADLQARMHAAAGDGRDGITPAMVDDIKQTLGSAQGSLSPEMQSLLDAVSKDGGKLTPETMKLLQNAAKGAKGQGMNLNIDKDTEKALLESDFSQDKTAPPGGM